MQHLPAYLWVFTFATVAAMVAATVYMVYRGALGAGLGPRRAAAVGGGAAAVLGGWLVASSVIAGNGGFHTHLGHGLPWLPIAVVGFFATLTALSRLPAVAAALNAPGTLARLMLPHAFRIEGVVFIIALLLGKLPALFAIPAGAGDIAVGIATPWITRKLADGAGHREALWFNLFGVIDLIDALVLGGLTGYAVVSVSPSAALNSELPLAIVPTVGVPLLLALHIRSLLALRNQNAVNRSLALNTAPVAA